MRGSSLAHLDRSPSLDRSIAALRDAVAGTAAGVHVVIVGQHPTREIENVSKQAASEHGYVVHRPGHLLAAPVREGLTHRHVVLLCVEAPDFLKAVPLLRALALSSPRRHVVIWPAPAVQRLASSPDVRRDEGGTVTRLADRANRLFGQKRWSAGRSWLRAAAGAAERRGQRTDLFCAQLGLSHSLLERGRIDEARAGILELLRTPDLLWTHYAEAAALWIDLSLVEGRLDYAAAFIRSLEAEALMRDEELPSAVTERRARVHFWNGDGKTCAVQAQAAQVSTEELAWLTLTSWKSHRLVRGLEELGHRAEHDGTAAQWAAVIRQLTTGILANPVVIASKSCSLALLFRVVRGRALIAAGQTELALAELGAPPDRSPESETIRALRQQACGEAVRSKVPGVVALTAERISMLSIEGLERLLTLMNDAPDEFAAATAGCAWLRRQSPDSSIGILSDDRRRLVAACGWKTARACSDGEQTGLSIPIRYGGTTVARLVISGGNREIGQLEAAQAFAMLAGPAVRACLDTLELRDGDRDNVPEVLGQSQAAIGVRQAIARAAGTPFSVLIEGESGTGKELAARAIHRLSARRDRKFLAVNCAALTDELVEAELFGHARGAFTGAIGPRAGLFEESNGGTLFLDEVAELSARAQAKLLRVLQEREVRRVGESTSRSIDVRIVAATNAPLALGVTAGRFRDDLRFRLAVIAIRLPPLRDRVQDIPLLSHVFWRRALADTGKRAYLGPDAMTRLAAHNWPGNIRELQNVIAAVAVAAPHSGRVTARHVGQVLGQNGGDAETANLFQRLDAARVGFERRYVAATLARHAGRRASAAQELGLTRQGLAKTLRRLGLDAGEPAGEESAAGVA